MSSNSTNAGTEEKHAEFNTSKSNEFHFLKIWVIQIMEGMGLSYNIIIVSDNSMSKRFQLKSIRIKTMIIRDRKDLE